MGFFDFLSKHRRVLCPDGTTKYIHKDVNSAIPTYVTKYDAKLFSRIGSEIQDDLTIGGEYKTRIHDLLSNRNEQYASLIHEFRVLYGVFSADPCSYSDYFLDGIKRILAIHHVLRVQSSNIQAYIDLVRTQPDDTALLTQRFSELQREMLYFDSQEITEAFETARVAAGKLGGRNDGR